MNTREANVYLNLVWRQPPDGFSCISAGTWGEFRQNCLAGLSFEGPERKWKTKKYLEDSNCGALPITVSDWLIEKRVR